MTFPFMYMATNQFCCHSPRAQCNVKFLKLISLNFVMSMFFFSLYVRGCVCVCLIDFCCTSAHCVMWTVQTHTCSVHCVHQQNVGPNTFRNSICIWIYFITMQNNNQNSQRELLSPKCWQMLLFFFSTAIVIQRIYKISSETKSDQINKLRVKVL